MKKHVVAHDAQQGKTGNALIDPTEQAEQTGVFTHHRFHVRWWNRDPDPGARTQPKPGRERPLHLAQGRVMYFHHELAHFCVSHPWGSAEGSAKVSVEEKPKRFCEAEPGREADEQGGTRRNQGCEVPCGLIEVRYTIQSGKIRES